MRNMRSRVIDRLFLVVLGVDPPTNDEWCDYLAAVERHGIDRTMQLIYTDGGAPDANQRHCLEEIIRGRLVPVAVVSPSARIRALVTAMSWFNRKIRAFPPSSFRDAIGYLEIPLSRVELIEAALAELREAL